ncbi:hypothetical protein SASPL_110018 [Salvia splendens]|uniref:Two-component response regulator ARR-B family n=1 Tax=Salvia splendens TaxID=180675 RepID=A0A8X8Y4Q0_SALSN|nr:hypothetical protein SASPL_110018 [Salvia splendens]
MTSYLSVMQELHVLFVDHEWDCSNTISLMETCQYRVTRVPFAGAAMSMLQSGNSKIDLIIANITSPDVFKLLQLAVSMEIPTILMSGDDDLSMAARSIENGAFLYIKRPTSPEMLRYLWQHVARETVHVLRERERLMAASYITPQPGVQFGNMENPNNFSSMDSGKRKNNDYFNEKYVEEEYKFDNSTMSQRRVKRKMNTEWTQELHEKFMDAVEQLGEGSCFPKEILEKMNVSGLTRMQVASHLQKCRNENWRSPEERKSTPGGNPKSPDSEGSSHKPRRFGSMPLIKKEKLEDRAYDHGSRSEMEAKATETGMANETAYHHQNGAFLPHPQNNIAMDMDHMHLSSIDDIDFYTNP